MTCGTVQPQPLPALHPRVLSERLRRSEPQWSERTVPALHPAWSLSAAAGNGASAAKLHEARCRPERQHPQPSLQLVRAPDSPPAAPRRRREALLLGVMVLVMLMAWSSSYWLIKVSIESVSASFIGFARAALGALVLGLVARVARDRGRRADRERVPFWSFDAALLGALMATSFVMLGMGERLVESGIAGVIVATEPMWVALILLRAGGMRTRGATWIGIMAGFVGIVVLLAPNSASGGIPMSGLAAVLAAAIAYAIATVYVPARLPRADAVQLTAVSCWWAAALTLPPALLTWPGVSALPTPVIAALLILGIVDTGMGLALYNHLLLRLGAARMSLILYLVPAFAIVIGALFLGERFGVTDLAGIALILCGVALGSRAGGRGARPQRPRAGGDAAAAPASRPGSVNSAEPVVLAA